MTTIIFELIRYVIFIIIGVFFIKFYVEKKGWDGSYGKLLLFNLIWKTLMLFMLIGLDFLMQHFISAYILWIVEIIILTMILSYFGDILFGILIFKYIYTQKIQESVIIISIIVLIEMILDNVIFYPLMYFINF